MNIMKPIMIMDHCCYTKSGIINQIRKIKSREVILDISSTNTLGNLFENITPRIVVINEDIISENISCLNEIRKIISENIDVLFVIFVTSFNLRYQELVLLDDNVIICSKEIDTLTLNALLSSDFFSTPVADNICRFILSPKERMLVSLWMAGMQTSDISKALSICSKTVSTHKGNIKKKLRTHNMQVIYNVIRMSKLLLLTPW